MSPTTNTPTDFDVCLDQMRTGLTNTQVDAIEQGLGERYLIDRHVSYEDGLALMISDATASDPDIVLYVDADPVGLSLSCLRGEVLHHVGCYTSVGGLLAAIQAEA